MDKIADAVRTLITAFQEDPNFRNVYESNIAMAVVDAVGQHRKRTGKQSLSYKDIYECANQAAESFVDLLMSAHTENPSTVTVVYCSLCQRGEYCADNERYSNLPLSNSLTEGAALD